MMMDDFKITDGPCHDLENILTSIQRNQELPILRPVLEMQDMINEQLKYEGSLDMESHCSEHPMLEDNSPTGHNPSTVSFPGSFLFSAEPDNSRSNKTWMYSDILRTVFIDVNKILAIKFSVNMFVPGLYIRAVPVYSSCDYSQQPVNRCPIHSKKDDPDFKAHTADDDCLCSEFNYAGHVLRVHSHTSQYHYNKYSKRHSVSTHLSLPQAGCSYITVPFSFACKTSCASGMQRRPIVIVFTLENDYCEVLGRQVVAVKICACPKRDMERLERDHHESEMEGDEGISSKKKVDSGMKRPHKLVDVDTQSLNKFCLMKKMKHTPDDRILSSDADNSDNELENMKKDLESAMQMISQMEPAFQTRKLLESTLQKVRALLQELDPVEPMFHQVRELITKNLRRINRKMIKKKYNPNNFPTY